MFTNDAVPKHDSRKLTNQEVALNHTKPDDESDLRNGISFYSSPPSLLQTCCLRAAIELWRKILHDQDQTKTLQELLVEIHIKVPCKLRKTFDKCYDDVRKQFEAWMTFHRHYVFFDDRIAKHDYYGYFDHLVWSTEGIVDCEKSAKNLVENSRIGLMYKFRLACTYCFEYDIRRMWPLLRHCRDEIDFDRHSLLKYWRYRMTGEYENPYFDVPANETDMNNCTRHLWNKNPLFDYAKDIEFNLNSLPIGKTHQPHQIRHIILNEMENRILDSSEVTNWSAIKYLWSRLDFQNQISKAKVIIVEKSPSCTMHLLPELDQVQLRRVVSQNATYIMLQLVFAHLHHQLYTLQAWNYIRHIIRQDHYIDMIREIWFLEDGPNIVYKLWINSPGRLKSHMIKKAPKEFWLYVDSATSANSFRDVRFVSQVLSEMEFQTRNEIWYENWSSLIVGTRIRDVIELTRMCLRNDDEVDQFKRTDMRKFANIEMHCDNLLRNGHLNELDLFLEFCSSSRNWRDEVKKKLKLNEIKEA